MRRVTLSGVAVAAIALLVATTLSACTAAPDTEEPAPPVVESTLPELAEPLGLDELDAFSGVATMNAGSNCTGTLIDTGVPAGPAYILTNGHCVGDVGRPAQRTTHDIAWEGTAEFLRAKGNLGSTLTVNVTQLAYSTMRQTDSAIVRLDSTLGELEDLGIRPVPIAADEPDEGADVVNIGVPVQELLEDEWIMRRGECTLGSQHTLIEFNWMWLNAWSNDCPGIRQGSSGSPLLSVDDEGAPQEIVGMINTTSWAATAAGACTINHPCQVEADGPVMEPDTSYAQSVAGFGGCFDADGVFALTDACPLPNSSIWAEGAGGAFRGGDAKDAVGRLPEATFVGAEAGEFRTGLVELGDGNGCLAPETYTDAAPQALPLTGEEWEIVGAKVPAPLPEVEGWYLLCAVRGDDYAGAASVIFEVDRTPPTIPADADVERFDDGWVVVRPHLNPPEISAVRFTWGPKGEVDCEDTSAFQDFFIAPLSIDPDELPVTYCVFGMDFAGNATDVTTIEIPAS